MIESDRIYAKILIVDDNPDHLVILRQIPIDYGHTVITADGFDTAVEILKEDSDLDILITDFKMEPRNGIELCQYINENYPYIEKIIITSETNLICDYPRSTHNVDALVYKVGDPTDRLLQLIRNQLIRKNARNYKKGCYTNN